ncbi:MAG TPA: hypothetical protein VHB79_30465 [Polyangiaceae bacterium]|nr:hypothetical protein [Polyangiaceae bacterium]
MLTRRAVSAVAYGPRCSDFDRVERSVAVTIRAELHERSTVRALRWLSVRK